jgi:hypothetical protein
MALSESHHELMRIFPRFYDLTVFNGDPQSGPLPLDLDHVHRGPLP